MVVHHAVGISRQRNSGYRPNRVNIMAQGLCTPDPSLSPTHLSIMKGCTTTTHYTHNQVSLMVSRNTTLVPSFGLRMGPACEVSFSAGMQRDSLCHPKREKKKERSPGPVSNTVKNCVYLILSKPLKILKTSIRSRSLLVLSDVRPNLCNLSSYDKLLSFIINRRNFVKMFDGCKTSCAARWQPQYAPAPP